MGASGPLKTFLCVAGGGGGGGWYSKKEKAVECLLGLVLFSEKSCTRWMSHAIKFIIPQNTLVIDVGGIGGTLASLQRCGE